MYCNRKRHLHTCTTCSVFSYVCSVIFQVCGNAWCNASRVFGELPRVVALVGDLLLNPCVNIVRPSKTDATILATKVGWR